MMPKKSPSTQTPEPGMLKFIVSEPAAALAAIIASRRVHSVVSRAPVPRSAVALTVKVATVVTDFAPELSVLAVTLTSGLPACAAPPNKSGANTITKAISLMESSLCLMKISPLPNCIPSLFEDYFLWLSGDSIACSNPTNPCQSSNRCVSPSTTRCTLPCHSAA